LTRLANLRIGYVPYGPTFDFPADRRRFCFYARERNIPFEIARPSEAYDVVVLSQAADVSVWSRYPRGRTKIVFDFVDSYLSIPRRDLKGRFRGLAKFASGQNRRLRLNYWTALEDMCRRADATVCGTAEQQKAIRPFCPNAHVILDSQSLAVRGCKEDYRAGEVLNFVWEGLGHNLGHLLEIREVLQDVRSKRPFVLHAVTELSYGRFLGRRFGKHSTLDDAQRIWPGMYLYQWHESTFPAIVRSCDLALIPIPLGDPFCAGKPENRLLLFWRMGMPVLASATPAHNRALQDSGLEKGLTSPQEWREALERFMSDEETRRRAGQTGRTFAETFHSNEKWLARWDQVFCSILQ
jgi:glycosyltransferase involved in cell wall biosynthesis